MVVSTRSRIASVALALLALSVVVVPLEAQAAGDPCAAPVTNPVACENTLPGNPASEWDVAGSGSANLQGFATEMSVNKGETVQFKIDTPATGYRLDVYRMGFYGGSGARKVATVNPSAALPQNQPACLTQTTTGLVDCGNWAVSASWPVPATAVSGVYFAKLVRTDGTAGSSHVFFVVRDDASTADLLFQTSDTTWQAYNTYGGNSLYAGQPAGRAYKVSYNRPFTTRGTGAEDWVFNAEYPMVRFLEANGYSVSYQSGIDTDRRGPLLRNHRTFLSVGHDEYWSGQQRANVEAARDAGVNLAFFSGNESFWKTRYESSIDGSATAYRTLVTYKETQANAKIDPLPSTWTGTWRDPRFSPPADGGRPENALTGTSFYVNAGTTNLQVPAADGKLRLWRNTTVATLAANATATLGTGTVGYEWDIDADNGARPAGLIKMSTTNATGVQVLQDYGSTYGTGNATHNVTLYRAPSGALVFGAGTVQWSWGLDSNHDRGSGAVSVPMQQATVNLFADMGVQPSTLTAALVAATASTDTVGPTTVMTSPAAGSTVSVGTPVTISGTATDTGGGVVGGVEVSTDGGTTWRPATGRATWTYTWNPSSTAAVTIRARAADDSANIGAAASVALSGPVPGTCPCTIFPSTAVPATITDPDTAATELGLKFRTSVAGTVSAIRFYKGPQNTGTHLGRLWTSTGTQLASVTFTGETASGWQQANLATPVALAANTTYVVSYYAPVGKYSQNSGALAAAGIDASPLRVLRDGEDGPNGVYRYAAGGGFPSLGYGSENYWVDVVFTPANAAPDTTPPTVTARTPAVGATGVATGTTVTATFGEPLQSGTAAISVSGPSGAVTGTTGFDAVSARATFTPAAALAAGTTYTATVSGARDLAGNTMAPVTWSFTTAAPPPPPTCPCSLFGSSVPVTAATTVTTARTVGVRFTADVAGVVTGIRFYKAATNTGTHVGRLWSNTGTQLATVTFTGESASGWQQATFATPVAITPGTTYVASYYAPVGRYARDNAYFTGRTVDNPPLRAPADGATTGNGVYATTNGFPNTRQTGSNYWVDVLFNPAVDNSPPVLSSTVPVSGATGVATGAAITATFNEDVQPATVAIAVSAGGSPIAGTSAYTAATRTVTFTPTTPLAPSTAHTVAVSGAKDTAGNTMTAASWSFTTAAPDTTAPTVNARTPAAGATVVATSTPVTATFSEDVVTGTPAIALTSPSGTVTGATAYNAATRTVTFTPAAPLSTATVYSATVSGARDVAGNTMAPASWSFTTAAGVGCPCTIWPDTTVPAVVSVNDAAAVELGVKFRANTTGYITGIRFYKGATNTGTHVGNLWTTAGVRLATMTFTGESASGWQTASFAAPVAVTANTTYVASYHTATGFYSDTENGFTAATTRGPLTALANGTDGLNGVYAYGAGGFPSSSYRASNYWVDVVFDTSTVDTTAPVVTTRDPAAGGQGASAVSPVTATFSEPVVAGSIAMSLSGPSGAVAATLGYDDASRTVTLTPAGALAYSTTYTVSLGSARDAAGNTMAPLTWTFTTGTAPPPGPDQGPGGPILVIKGGVAAASGFSSFAAEILRAEGLNAFATADIATVTPATLGQYDVVLLGSMPLSAAQVTAFTNWVNAGGNLVAFKPDAQLAPLLGLAPAAGTLTDAHLGIDTATAPGTGITSQTMQFHGTADRYTLSGARAVATLYATPASGTVNPAVTLRGVGTSGGEAAAFTFDLPRSIVYTRQGNPAWAGQERDGQSPRRSDDLFFGGASPDWVDLNKVAIPQADEQQRLLTNLIQTMNSDRAPLPRLWYFPRNAKAVVVATGDDHGNNGTAGRFDQYLAASPQGCSVANWECPRFTSYMYPSTPLSSAAANAYRAQGFELALHPSSNCSDFTQTSLAADYTRDISAFKAKWPGLPSPTTSRLHCIVWSDWASQPKVELANGIRLDTNYYYWPGAWVADRPGFMTGSGMPMRFADTDGTLIDVYQAATQMTDESNQSYPATPNALLDNALGANGYYGAFTANVHTDLARIPESDALLASAQARGVPIVTAEQMLTWVDGRNASSFSNITRNGATLSFTLNVGTGANGLTAMLPTAGAGGSTLSALTLGGTPVSFTRQTIKGIEYAVFQAAAGSYSATY